MGQEISALIEKSVSFSNLVKTIRGGQMPCSVLGVTPNARAFFAQALHRSLKKQIVFVTSTEQSARAYADICGGTLFLDDEPILRNVAARSRESELERIGVLKNAPKQEIVFLSARSLIKRMMPRSNFMEACTILKIGEQYHIEAMLEKLTRAGYERVGTVYSKGEFARRGEILDIYPADAQRPLRITFFDDEIETIKSFDAETQKSEGRTISEYLLPPAREIILSEEARKRILEYLSVQDGAHQKAAEEILFEIHEYGAFEVADTFMPVMFEPASIVEYFPDALFMFDDFERIDIETKRVRQEFLEEFKRLGDEVFTAQSESYFNLKAVTQNIIGQIIDIAAGATTRLKTVGHADMDMRAASGFSGRMELLAHSIKDRKEHGYSIYLFAGPKAQALSKALAEYDVIAPVSKGSLSKGVFISEEQISYGFEIPSASAIVLGANDIFGRLKKAVTRKKQKNAQEDIFSDLSVGDFVVHDIHGKGKYLGLKTLEAAGHVAEYMEVEYRGGDKLYIPTAQIDRVQKYIGNEDAQVQLSKLGGKEWENAKSKARESALKLAFDLVELYAKRFDNSGYAFSKDTVWQNQFEDSFEYEETEGQLESIEEIKKDMESSRVMDRLLLGDVGYGKTEVAMRAAFKAVMDGKQVAMLVPTTLLARQHLKTFQERFAEFPVTIEGLSRFSKSRHKAILSELNRGKIDIIIGTHRLLSSDVHFYDLGLLIVDEEQRFGVSHKEKN